MAGTKVPYKGNSKFQKQITQGRGLDIELDYVVIALEDVHGTPSARRTLGARAGERKPMESTMRHVIAFAVIIPAFALTATVASAAGSGKFCLQGPGSTLNCNYQTMALCDKAKKSGQACIANPGTTGSGMTNSTMSPPAKSPTTTSPAKKY